MLQNQDKHLKYKGAYKPNELYWGLGVEHETYIETSKLKQVSLKELKEDRKQERYCVNYYSVYNTESLDKALDGLFNQDEKILIPILLNSHTFQKTDINAEHITTYERIPKPNAKFNGQTLHDWMKKENPDVFLEDYEKAYIFDGDTVEFMTQRFYKANVRNVVDELISIERDFMRALNSLPRDGFLKTYGPFRIAQQNYPFASYLTNLKNNAMFNNGTIHINITLPTMLNDKAEIADMDLFIEQHRNYARVIQWLSPLLLAKYGTYDPLCESKTNGERFSAGSQRVAVSRYIGLGTYDTDTMEQGKILTRGRDKLCDIDWYESFHNKVDYKFLDDLGMDINFNKHFCHGLEFRILEAIPYDDIYDVLIMMVYLADFSLARAVENPKKCKVWHTLAENCVHNGKGYYIDVSDQNDLFDVFGISYLSKEPLPAVDVLSIIMEYIMENYKNGDCVKYMIHGKSSESHKEKHKEKHNEEEIQTTPKPSLITVPSTITLPTIPEISRSSSSSSSISFTEITPQIEPIMPVETVQPTNTAPIAPKPRKLCC
jgi:hypothetical protein